MHNGESSFTLVASMLDLISLNVLRNFCIFKRNFLDPWVPRSLLSSLFTDSFQLVWQWLYCRLCLAGWCYCEITFDHYQVNLVFPGRGIPRGSKGGTILRAPNHCGGVQKSHQCHKYFLQYSIFASGRPRVRTWGRQTCFLPRAPSNLVMPLFPG